MTDKFPTRPQPTLQIPGSSGSDTLNNHSASDDSADYDPSAFAKPCSPFYLYNHDSPRPSGEEKYKPVVEVTIKDLELGESNLTPVLTPTISQEKFRTSRCQRPGPWRFLSRNGQERRCMTQPKPKSWLRSLPQNHRLMVKLLIAFLVAGCMVAIGVGIGVGVNNAVNRNP